MAELGSINTRDVHAGTAPVTDTAGQAALAGTLSLAGTLVQKGAEADLQGDLQDDATEALSASQAPVPVTGLLPGDTAIIELHNEIRKHQATSAQATDSNARARAQLAMQETLQTKMRKYGWMKGELQAEYNKFVGASPEMTQLGINDASSTGRRAQSQSFLDELTDLAYGRGPLDFKMDPATFQIGTIEFSREYNRQSLLMTKRIALEQEETSLVLTDRVNARQAMILSEKQLYAEEGGVSALYNNVQDAYSSITTIREAVALGDTSPATTLALAEAEQDWNTSGKAQTLKLLDDSINQIEARFNRVWGSSQGVDGVTSLPSADPLYETSRRNLEKELSALLTLRELIDADNKDVTDILNGVAVLRGHRVLSNTNNLQTIADLAAAAPTLLNNADKLGLNVGAAAKFDKYGRSGGLTHELTNVLQTGSVLHGVGTLDNAGLNAEEILQAQDKARLTGKSLSGVLSDDRDPAMGTAGSYVFMEQMIAAYKDANNPIIKDEARSLAYMNGVIWALGNSLNFDTTPLAGDKAAIRDLFADPTQYDFIAEVEGGRENPTVNAMAQRMGDYWTQKAGDSRSVWLSEIGNAADETFGGLRASAYLHIETSEMYQGKLSFSVNEDNVYKAFGTTRTQGNRVVKDPAADANARHAIHNLRETAAYLTDQVSKFIQMDTFVNWVIRPGVEKNFLPSIIQKGGGGENARSLNTMFSLFDAETATIMNHGVP